MKKRVMIAASAALLANSFLTSPGITAVTLIDTVSPTGPDGTTMAAMEAQCDAKATAHSPAWSGEVDQSSIVATLVSGPTEVGTEADRDIDESTRVGAGTFTPAHVEIMGDPYRNGGSVNMFGIQQAVGGTYSASAYDFMADFTTTYSYAFNCTMSETVHTPVEGYYIVEPEDQGDEEASQNSCNAFTALGPTWEHWGNDHAQCDFVKTGGDEDVEEARPDETGTPVTETQTDNLKAHEDNGAGFSTSETLIIGQVVVCISPAKTGPKGIPGTWTRQNGYTGDKCTTAWYNGGATVGVPNLNDGSHNWVTVPVV